MKNELSAIIAVLGLTCISASASPATPVSSSCCSTMPPSACFSDYLESKDNFYASVTGGAIFFEGPIKDQSNIYKGNGALGGNPAVSAIEPSSTNDITGSIGGTFGYILDRNPQENWLGHNLRAEANGDYYQTSVSSFEAIITAPTNFVSMGRLDGQNSNIVVPTFFGPNAPDISFSGHEDMYDGNIVLKSDYSLAQGAFVFTPEVGVSFARLNQRYSTDISGFSPTLGGFANEEEHIDTEYYGAVFGFELKANVTKNFVPFLSAVTTLGYAQSNYFGSQEYNSLFNNSSENGNDSVSDSRGDFSAREQINAGFYYDFGPVILKVSGGVDYWSSVATVQEATVPSGSLLSLGQNPNVEASHLTYASMANPEAKVTVIVPF